MSSSRRSFLVAAGLASAGVLLPRGRAWGSPAFRVPAAETPPQGASEAVLADSRLLVDEPLAVRAVEAAQKAGASYADARLVLWRRDHVSVRDDHIAGVGARNEYGIGVRVLADGAWGFAASSTVDRKTVERLAKDAVAMAKRNGRLRRAPIELAAAAAAVGTWVAPFTTDPFKVPLKDKADMLLAAAQAALKVPGIRHANASAFSVREEKLLITSEGTRTHQAFFRVMPGLTASAVDIRRGRFASRDHEVQPALAGWEHVVAADLVAEAPRIAEEALQKLHAAPVEPGLKTVILAPSNLWLTIHESIGHSTELDRALGMEANYAGTSFIKPEQTGSLRIGAERVSFFADRTQAGGLATTAWDDEGVAAQRWPIVKDGVLVGWQTTRALAGAIGEATSRGCSYADSYGTIAFQRMPNISLQPGPEGYTTEDLINATDDGVLISGRGSWSIDQQRYNFQFGGQMFWEIKNGRLRRPLRDVA
ncbi:MAG: TldD/PmbA family protein, partial [Myxococcales bacterium]|nr:TldD/PmbA family protein [Myxococcales bacterium]